MSDTSLIPNDQEKLKTIAIGMGGWEIPSFNDVFYPAKPEKGFRKLEYYSRFFDLVEVNATFYNTSLSSAQARRWLNDIDANPRFIFTVKLYRGFTHSFDATKSDALAILRLLEPLRSAGKLGGLVAQFSSSFGRTSERETYLVKLQTIFSDDHLFFDIRHRSWDNETFYQFCNDHNLHLINVDLPQLENHMPFNSRAQDDIAYFRMMGRNVKDWNDYKSGDRYLYSYSEEELKDLAMRIQRLNAAKIYVVFHNDRQSFSLVNGRQLEHSLNPKKRLRAPDALMNVFPQLKSLCEPVKMKNDLFSDPKTEISNS